jgi:hypothetical protein
MNSHFHSEFVVVPWIHGSNSFALSVCFLVDFMNVVTDGQFCTHAASS